MIVKVILLHKISILNKFCYFELFHSSKNPVSKVKKNTNNKSAFLELFLKDHHETLKPGVMADENSALHHRNKLYFIIFSKRKLLF